MCFSLLKDYNQMYELFMNRYQICDSKLKAKREIENSECIEPLWCLFFELEIGREFYILFWKHIET